MKKFRHVVADPDHYINRVVEYMSGMTDAPKDIHEAYALMHLSIACKDIRWKFNPRSTVRERFNLYFVYYGESGEARKSTVMQINRSFFQEAFSSSPFFQGESFTPQGLRDGLVEREGLPTIIHFDEMEDVFLAMSSPGSNMGQLPTMLKELYSNPKFVTRLSSVGKKRSECEIRIDKSYVCLMGNVTPTITTRLPPQYLTDGLIARMHIVMRSSDHRFRGMEHAHKFAIVDNGVIAADKAERLVLTGHLRGIHSAISRLDVEELLLQYDDAALKIYTTFENKINRLKKDYGQSYEGNPSFERLKTTAVKISGLIAAGRLGEEGITRGRGILVSRQDAIDGMKLTTKLLDNIRHFVSLCVGTVESRHCEFLTNRIRIMVANSSDPYVMESELVRSCRNRLRRKDFNEAISVMLKTGEVSMGLIGDKVVYQLPAVAELSAEPVAPEVDDLAPGQEEPF